MPAPTSGAVQRARNPRGQGNKLREDIIRAAAELLAESGNASRLTLRGVARRVGIASTSVYMHFADTEQLCLAVTEHCFDELRAATAAARDGIEDPVAALVEGCKAYCRYALDNPGYYRVMFDADIGLIKQSDAGRRAFESLDGSVRRVLAVTRADSADSSVPSALMFAGLHGLVSLRISRPYLPWPPADAMLLELVMCVTAPSNAP